MTAKALAFAESPVLGHRGACGYAPENTLAAFRAAKAMGVRWVEFDVMLSADGEAVVIHDNTLSRTTNGNGLVADHDYAHLEKLDAGSWFDADFKDEKIPRLIDVIGCMERCKLSANIEIKPAPGQELKTVDVVMDIVNKEWPAHLPAPLYSSFSAQCCERIRYNSDDALLGLLYHEWDKQWQQQADALQASSIHLHKRLATAARVQAIKASGRQVLCYTVNTAREAKRLYALGVDAVFSDYPDRILETL